MSRPATVLDVGAWAGVVIAALSNSPAWWLALLIAVGLFLLSDRDARKGDDEG